MKRILCLFLCAILMLPVLVVSPRAADYESAPGATIKNLGIPMKSYIPDNSAYLYARTVWGMEAFRGKIYIGCGDYDQNVTSKALGGMLPLMGYDPSAGTWKTEARFSDEQYTRFFVAGNTLYVAGTDPCSGSNGQYFYYNGTYWRTNYNGIANALHLFDLLLLDDGNTIFAGAGLDYSATPVVYLSVNGGKLFRKIGFRKDGVDVKGSAFTGGDNSNYYRTYNLFEYQGEVYATFWCSNGEIRNRFGGLYRFHEQANVFEYYCDVPYSLLCTSMSQSYDLTFKDQYVFAYGALQVFSKDLKSYRTVGGFSGSVTCARAVGDALYFTTYQSGSNGQFTSRLYKTTDLKTCELLTEFDYTSYVRSFCYDKGVFYMGTESNRFGASDTTGTVFSVRLQPKNCTHVYGEWIEDTPPDCTAGGIEHRACEICGNVEKHNTPATGIHNFSDWKTVVDATCVAPGKQQRTCLVCGKTEEQEIPVNDHHSFCDWQRLTEPTCTEAGSEQRKCSVCGEVETHSIDALGHEYSDEWTVDLPATEHAPGSKSRHCIRCDQKTDVTEIPQVTEFKTFEDIETGKWYYEAVRYAVTTGLFNGVSDTIFAPDKAMNRAMLVSVLYRMENSPAVTDGNNPFSDVAAGKYYTDAVLWAAGHEIVTGTSADKFSPNRDITREQMAAILYRYSQYKERDTSATADLSVFPDADKTSSYAQEALAWANAQALITGTRSGDQVLLNPKGSATRAQVATILMRYQKTFEK